MLITFTIVGIILIFWKKSDVDDDDDIEIINDISAMQNSESEGMILNNDRNRNVPQLNNVTENIGSSYVENNNEQSLQNMDVVGCEETIHNNKKSNKHNDLFAYSYSQTNSAIPMYVEYLDESDVENINLPNHSISTSPHTTSPENKRAMNNHIDQLSQDSYNLNLELHSSLDENYLSHVDKKERSTCNTYAPHDDSHYKNVNTENYNPRSESYNACVDDIKQICQHIQNINSNTQADFQDDNHTTGNNIDHYLDPRGINLDEVETRSSTHTRLQINERDSADSVDEFDYFDVLLRNSIDSGKKIVMNFDAKPNYLQII